MTPPRTQYATAADLASLYGVPLGTIYRWASTHHWERTSPHHRPVRYSRDQADDTYWQHNPARRHDDHGLTA